MWHKESSLNSCSAVYFLKSVDGVLRAGTDRGVFVLGGDGTWSADKAFPQATFDVLQGTWGGTHGLMQSGQATEAKDFLPKEGITLGSWGVGILSDDTAVDVHGEYMDKFNDGMEHAAIHAALEEEFADCIVDVDEGPVYWLALALAQWECGVLEPDVLRRVTDLITSKQTLDRWEEAGAAQVRKRQQVLERFLEKISQPNQKPKRRRKVKHLPAVYAPGDCLAIKLEDGDYGAALVLARDETPKAEGRNLVGVLRYKNKEKPPLSVFEGREWLYLTHHSWKGDKPEMHWCPAHLHKEQGAALEVVGRVALREDDIRESNSYGGWNLGLQPVLQERWDQGERD